METDNMSNITVQGRLGFYSGHAPATKLQRIHVSGSSERGCSSLESERGNANDHFCWLLLIEI